MINIVAGWIMIGFGIGSVLYGVLTFSYPVKAEEKFNNAVGLSTSGKNPITITIGSKSGNNLRAGHLDFTEENKVKCLKCGSIIAENL